MVTAFASNSLPTLNKENEELDKIQRLIASQKPTDCKLNNNSLKDSAKKEKENSNPLRNTNEIFNINNIKDQKLNFFNKHKPNQNEKHSSEANYNNENNENLNPNRKFSYESTGISNSFRNQKAKGLVIRAEKKNAICGKSDPVPIDIVMLEPSYNNCKDKSGYFYAYNSIQVWNRNNYYEKRYDNNKGKIDRKEFIPRFQFYKNCKKADVKWCESDRLWGYTMQPGIEILEKGDA